ncbi:MAG: sulfurtransferase [Dehalococcoidia bacterium]|nr:sulfurtransferase [Dehalococcoidia bacterium]
MGDKGYAREELLVDVEWLKSHVDDSSVKILDTRPPQRYAAGHIKGAINLLVGRLDNPASPVRSMPLPTDRYAMYVGNLGIGNNDHVVIYDEQGLVASSRVFWVMDYYGHGKLSLLDGGFVAWAQSGGEVTTDIPQPTPKQYSANPGPDKLVEKSDMQERLGKPEVGILDTRTPAEYRGEMVQAMKGGHIPGAVNIDWTNAMTPGNPSSFRPASELEDMYAKSGITKDKEVITYCQSGVRSAHSYFVLRLLGYDRVKNYPASWGEWGNDPSTPVEK